MYVSAGPPWGHQAARVIEFASSLAVLIWWLDGFQSFPVLYAAVLYLQAGQVSGNVLPPGIGKITTHFNRHSHWGPQAAGLVDQ